jgi:hypothetical protein
MQQWLDLFTTAGGLLNLLAALTNLTTAVLNRRTMSRRRLTRDVED